MDHLIKAIQNNSYLNAHTYMNAFILNLEKFLLTPILDDLILISLD